MQELFTKPEKYISYVGVLISLIIIYVIDAYAGYVLYTSTFLLISPDMLPKTAWYWIVAECCIFGLFLTVVNVLAFFKIFLWLENADAEKESGSSRLRSLIRGLSLRPNTNRNVFSKLQNYLYQDFTIFEKRLLLKLKDIDVKNEIIYNKVLNECITTAEEVQKLRNQPYNPENFVSLKRKLSLFINSHYQDYVAFIQDITQNESLLLQKLTSDVVLNRLNNQILTINEVKNILAELINHNPFTKYDSTTYQSICDKLSQMISLNLSDSNINTLMECYSTKFKSFMSLIDKLRRREDVDSERNNIASFIVANDVFDTIAMPMEKIFQINKRNNAANTVAEIISFLGLAAIILSIVIIAIAFKSSIYDTPFNFMFILILGEFIAIIILFCFSTTVNKMNERYRWGSVVLYIVLTLLCFLWLIWAILFASNFVIKNELQSRGWFQTINEKENKGKDGYADKTGHRKITKLFVDHNILKQLQLIQFKEIANCNQQESHFCYQTESQLADESQSILNSQVESYVQLKNFKMVYLVRVTESSAAYLRDNYGRTFKLDAFGKYYFDDIESILVFPNKPDDKPGKSSAPKKSCTAIPSYAARLSLYSESEFDKKCMYYLSDDKPRCIILFSNSDKCN